MKRNPLTNLALAAFSLTVASATSMAADYIWQGSGGNWSIGSNWQGNNPPTGSATLYFSGAAQTSTNNAQLTSVSGINFNADAGAFILDGSALNLGGNIVNHSTSIQTIGFDLAMTGHRTYNARYGASAIVVEGDISGAYQFRKAGLGTVEIKGTNSYTDVTQILAGKLIVNSSNISANRLELGTAAGGYGPGNNASIEFLGGNYTHSGSLGIYNYAANKIIAGAGVAFTGTTFTNPANGTINFDISAAGSSIAFSTAPTTTTGDLARLHLSTVTDGVKTGFARTDTENGNKIVRFTDDELVDLLTNPANNQSMQARLNGDLTLSVVRVVNSLTLQGAEGGTIDATGTSQNLQTREILMEEGTGDYTFKNVRTVSQGLSPLALVVHQYSTSGTLTFESALLSDGSTHSFIKTGPGTVILTETSNSNYTGATRVHGGRFELDGTLSDTSSMTVYDGGALVGGGSYGASTTATLIRAGASLGGTSSRALDITGAVTMETDSTFTFTLDSGIDFIHVTDAILLQDSVNLQLDLTGAPTPDTPLYLLRSDTGITGNFVFNNVIISDQDTFSLNGYEFRYFQDAQNIWVQTIPEPSTVWLAALGLTAALYGARLRKGRQS